MQRANVNQVNLFLQHRELQIKYCVWKVVFCMLLPLPKLLHKYWRYHLRRYKWCRFLQDDECRRDLDVRSKEHIRFLV